MGLISRVSSRTYRDVMVFMLSKTGVFIVRNLNHYQTLGLHKQASTKEIKSKFRELSKKCHPDMYPDDPQKEAVFKQLNDAYQVLSDKGEREAYDKTLVGTRYSGSGNPIRSAKDYARYKREQENLYNDINDKPYTRGNFNNPNSNRSKNKYGFANEQNFGGAPNDDNEHNYHRGQKGP